MLDLWLSSLHNLDLWMVWKCFKGWTKLILLVSGLDIRVTERNKGQPGTVRGLFTIYCEYTIQKQYCYSHAFSNGCYCIVERIKDICQYHSLITFEGHFLNISHRRMSCYTEQNWKSKILEVLFRLQKQPSKKKDLEKKR